jgi:uncharacterized OsmC-like protein
MTDNTAPEEQHIETFRATATGRGWPTEIEITNTAWKIHVDEPEDDGGTGTAPNPMHYFTASLASCQNEQAQVVAEELQVALTRIDMTIEIMLNLDGFMGMADHSEGSFQQVRFSAVVHGDASADEIDELGYRVDARCPVLSLLRSAGCVIESRWTKA